MPRHKYSVTSFEVDLPDFTESNLREGRRSDSSSKSDFQVESVPSHMEDLTLWLHHTASLADIYGWLVCMQRSKQQVYCPSHYHIVYSGWLFLFTYSKAYNYLTISFWIRTDADRLFVRCHPQSSASAPWRCFLIPLDNFGSDILIWWVLKWQYFWVTNTKW